MRSLATLTLAAAAALTTPAHAHKAHVHGVMNLNLAIDGPVLVVELVTPQDSLVGHERRPRPGAETTAAAAAQPARASILVTFVTNSADLTAGAKSALDVLAAAMKSEKLASVKFTIEGHADPRGSEELNMRLSQARAESVRAYLTSAHGLAAERVNAVGKGSSALMNPSDPAAPENRRVTIVAQPG